MIEISTSMVWQSRANCAGADPELFFPERGASLAEARAVCAGCTVRTECLDYALAIGEKYGVWGGLSERERRRLRPKEAGVMTMLDDYRVERCDYGWQVVKVVDLGSGIIPADPWRIVARFWNEIEARDYLDEIYGRQRVLAAFG